MDGDARIDVRWVSPSGVERWAVGDIPELLRREAGFVWVDVPRCDREAASMLARYFAFHPLAIKDCQEPVGVAKMHAYRDHIFIVLHGLIRNDRGALDPIQYNHFIGFRYLVTIHGPVEQRVPYRIGISETGPVASRLESGRIHPDTPAELGHAIVAGQARAMETLLGVVARRVSELEERALRGDTGQANRLLDTMFRLRLELVTIRTNAVQARDVYQRVANLMAAAAPENVRWAQELADHFGRIISLCDGEKELLQDLLDFYQTRLTNDLNVVVKRFTSVGAILVLCTLVTGVYGMNFEHMPELSWKLGYPLALGTMLGASGVLTFLFNRRGWL